MATITGVSIKRLLTYLLIFIPYLRIRCLPIQYCDRRYGIL